MSNERHSQDDLSDPLVSRAYRELSDEHAPEHLDHMVLNEARRAAKPGYATTVSWLRPAAWITTIGLCLAIVLEVSDTTSPVQPMPGTPTEVEQEPAKLEGVLTETRQDQPAALSGRLEEKSAADASAVGLTDAKRQQPAAIEVDSFHQDDRSLLREAEDRARMQTGSDQDSAETLQRGAPALGVASDAALERHCDESETEDPNDWLDCILALEQQGLLDAAKAERDLLRESFPDAPSLISR